MLYILIVIAKVDLLLPADREIRGLVAIIEQQHDEYMKVIEEKMEAEMRLKREEVGDAQE